MRRGPSGLMPRVMVTAVAVIAGACSPAVSTLPPVPTPAPVAQRPVLTDRDRGLARFDPAESIKGVAGGQACRVEGGGGGGDGETFHSESVVICPRAGDDRTIYFLLVDAIEADLRRIGTVPGRGQSLGVVPEPLSTVWDVRGDAYRGSVRALGVNGLGNISIFVSMDLVVP